jgi:8-oxo-dGTP diphosphatase
MENQPQGMSREAYEEIGIQIEPLKLKAVHVMHRKTNRLNVDIFFECASWEGSIINREPNKCERIAFFPLDVLPLNVVDYNVTALKAIREGNFYSECGWMP